MSGHYREDGSARVAIRIGIGSGTTSGSGERPLNGARRRARLTAGLLGLGAVLGCAAACDGSGGTARPVAVGRHSTPADGASGVQYVETQAAAPVSAHCDAPAVIAHRGESGDGKNLPENTWQAELDASATGVTYLNVDVRWTSDGVPVALHDATVNRTTSETRPRTAIASLTAAQYTALDSRGYAGDTKSGRTDPTVHPDTLAQLLAKVAPTGKPIVIQMEADPYLAADTGAGSTPQKDFANLAQVIQHSGYAGRVIVAGWTLADLRALHAAAPNIEQAYLYETIGAKTLPTAHQITAAGAHILYIDFRSLNAAEITAWRDAGLRVWTWTPGERTQWQKLRTDGVEAIATNWATNYLRWAPIPCSADSSE